MTFPILGGNGAVAGYSIDNSLRFNDGDSPTLSRTFASTGNRKTWTFSYWIKRSTISTVQQTFAVGTNAATPWFLNYINSDDTLQIWFHDGTSSYFSYGLNQLKDVSAWYHIMYVVDTTQSTASDRLKVYINGSEMTWNTYAPPAQNFDTQVNTTNTHYIGRAGNGQYFDGYIAETYFIDGQALSPTDFGEFDEDSGVWKPKQYAGTYGTNGFYLKFNNTGNMGEDSSGNDNTWTPTNLSGTTDVTTDTPTNNFNTLNPLSYLTAGGGVAWSEGNCRVEMTSNATDLMCNGTFAVSSGKWYFEWKVTDLNVLAGIHDADAPLTSNNYNNSSLVYIRGGSTLQAPVDVTGLTSIATNDIVSMFVDLDNFTVKTAVNGVDDGYTKSIEQKTYTFGNCTNGSSSSSAGAQFNFGNPSFAISSGNSDANGYGNFEYSPNDGTYDYLALCTQNLATELSPTIDDGSQYFNTVLYSGNGSTQSITGVGFQPDWLWIKSRTFTDYHGLFDSNRGSTKRLFANAADAETTQTLGVTSFDSDGFSLGSNLGQNRNSNNFVAWNWLANGGTTSSNTDGSITSTVQANTTAGFSIVTYTGVVASSGTFGHGLGKQCDMVIIKNRTNPNSWVVQHKDLSGSTYVLNLDGTGAQNNDGSFGITGRSSTTISVGSGNGVNGNGYNYVAYCFADIEGYSKFGKYTGNGSTDGTFVYTGFRPAWVLYKKSSAAENWHILDNKRDTLNPNSFGIDPNTASAEANDANLQMDFLSNGFKLRTSHGTANQSGQTYIYMAFAENPFVSSGAVPVTAR
jgi:hypothetical protein